MASSVQADNYLTDQKLLINNDNAD